MICKLAAMNIDDSVNNELDLDWRLSSEYKGKSDELQNFIRKFFESLTSKEEVNIDINGVKYKINPKKYYFSDQRFEVRNRISYTKKYESGIGPADSCCEKSSN